MQNIYTVLSESDVSSSLNWMFLFIFFEDIENCL